jgi:hypothetical protein
LLFACRLFKRPLGTGKLLRTFGRHMMSTDILKLLASPFRRRKLTRQRVVIWGKQRLAAL